MIDAATADSWTLPDSAASNVVYGGFDGGTVKLVRTPPGANDTTQFTLRLGQTPKARPLAFAGAERVSRIIADAAGDYFAADSIYVTRLRSDFTVDSTFAVNGLATADYPSRVIFADRKARVLTSDGRSLSEELV